MKAKPIKEVLTELLKGPDFHKINESISLEQGWKKTVGNLIANNTKVSSFICGKLTITTSNPVWRNELALQKSELVEKLNQTIPDTHIKEIIFR